MNDSPIIPRTTPIATAEGSIRQRIAQLQKRREMRAGRVQA